MLEKFFYGQGKVYSRPIGVVGAKWRWWGDVSALSGQASIEKVEHKESHSGFKTLVRSFPNSTVMNLSGTMHQLDTASLAEMLGGIVTTVAAGSKTGEVLGTVAAGDIIKLEHAGVSSLVITDSLGSPATIDDDHYVHDPRFGHLEFLTLPSSPAPTMPLKAAYSYAGEKYVSFLRKVLGTIELRYEGINLAEGGAPVIAEFYKVQAEPLQELALITDGTDVAGFPFSCGVLLDSSKPASGDLGQFGRYREITMPA